MTTIEEIRKVYPSEAAEIDDTLPPKRCRRAGCRALIWWGYTAANHKPCPFDVAADGSYTGTSHWRTCLDRPRK